MLAQAAEPPATPPPRYLPVGRYRSTGQYRPAPTSRPRSPWFTQRAERKGKGCSLASGQLRRSSARMLAQGAEPPGTPTPRYRSVGRYRSTGQYRPAIGTTPRNPPDPAAGTG